MTAKETTRYFESLTDARLEREIRSMERMAGEYAAKSRQRGGSRWNTLHTKIAKRITEARGILSARKA